MIERVVPHPAGRFTRCRCGHEPRHIRATRHSLECRCGARTGRHPNLTQAETEWGTDYAQQALPLRVRRNRKVA